MLIVLTVPINDIELKLHTVFHTMAWFVQNSVVHLNVLNKNKLPPQ